MSNRLIPRLAAGLLAACLLPAAWAHPEAAQVRAEGAWARASVAGQQASGAFMRLTAQEPLRLVGVETPAAAAGEVHEMRMEGEVMRMRALDGLDLLSGQPLDLKPGGYHLMLQQLKAPLVEGSQLPLTLVFRDAKGGLSRLHLQLPVRKTAPGAGAGGASHAHGH